MARKKKSNNSSNGGKKTSPPKAMAMPLPPRPKLPPNKPRMVGHALVEKVCAITDPFCPSATGSKWPDQSQIRSLPYTMHGRFAYGSDAAGNGGKLVVPSWLYQQAGATAGTAFTYTTWAASLDGSTLTPATVRVVSWGCIIRNTLSPMNASGMVRLRTFNNPFGGNLLNTSAAGYACDQYFDIPVADCHEVVFIGRRFDNTASDFVAPTVTQVNNTVTSYASNGWSALQIGIDGAPVSTAGILDVEVFINFELAFDDGVSFGLIATKPPKMNDTLVQTAINVTNATPTFVKDGVVAAGRLIVGKATTMLATALFGPLAGGATRAMIAD